jgi:hypothetical protein
MVGRVKERGSHSRRGAGRRGVAGCGGIHQWHAAGVRMIERIKRERDQLRRREPQMKTYFCGDTIDTRGGWAGEEGFSLHGKRGRRGWLGQRPSGPVRLAGTKVRNE